ncbi:hypothetical protein UR09_05500 [Candidatus Nitromaritima sp. SCGC AAA799-A02]|nr:hypothetical protein UZ36_07100 [Candidatus Nitromaritima sp. SCGC AAA799-C22]KMP10681.1 hypothetical protein UR09_05500 [Candidatus Nitromaritima sp. SCGC AAA799-A02]
MNIDTEKGKLYYQAAQVFTPHGPIVEKDLFAGRSAQISRTLQAVTQPGVHCVIFGDRGVGKTSLGNVLQSFISSPKGEITSVRVNCDSQDNFDSIWRKIFEEIPHLQKTFSLNQTGSQQLELGFNLADTIATEPITPNFIRKVLTLVGETCVLYIIIDEYDRIYEDSEAELFSDLIKSLSDFISPVTLIFIGVADSVTTLISQHKSVERALMQVKMPRMDDSEIKEILETRWKQLGVSYDEGVIQIITKTVKGLPYYAHLLGMHFTQYYATTDAKQIDKECLFPAIINAVKDSHQSIQDEYTLATEGTKRTPYPKILFACAETIKNEYGCFTQTDIAQKLSEIEGKEITVASIHRNIKQLCEAKRGKVLERIQSGAGVKYRFKNPLLEPFIIMKNMDKF